MARKATASSNSPTPEDVQHAVRSIEQRYTELATERGKYMQLCRRIREEMGSNYDAAALNGISKKLLQKIIKERDLERKIASLTDDLESDEQRELEMLIEALGEFGDLPLGKAAIAQAEGKAALKSVGA